jgi:hypothetical protein
LEQYSVVRRRLFKLGLFAAGTAVLGLFPGCLVPLIPLIPLGLRFAGNAVIDFLLDMPR